MREAIERLLDEKVRPLFSNHGGGIEIAGIEGGTLKVKMLGQCSSCMSASSDVEDIVTKEVKAKFPQIKEVVLVTGVSEDLIAMARELLNGR
ncbi:MAG: NifU family protein [Proteocatella sp.]